MNFLVLPIFFLSGALFPLDHLPKVLGVITDVDPLSYGIDGLRGVLIGRDAFRAADRPGGSLCRGGRAAQYRELFVFAD